MPARSSPVPHRVLGATEMILAELWHRKPGETSGNSFFDAFVLWMKSQIGADDVSNRNWLSESLAHFFNRIIMDPILILVFVVLFLSFFLPLSILTS